MIRACYYCIWFVVHSLSRNCTPDTAECVSTEVLIDGFNENGTPSATHSPGDGSASPPDEYRKESRSPLPAADSIRLRRNADGAEVHLQIPMEKLGTFHGYVTAAAAAAADYHSPSHQQRYQRIRYVEYHRGQSTDDRVAADDFKQSLINYEHNNHHHHQQQGKMDPNSSYVTLESVTDVYQQQQQQQNYQQQQNSYQTYQPYEQSAEQPAADMFDMYEKTGHGGSTGDYGNDVKNGHQKSGYGQQAVMIQQQQQQQSEYQNDGNEGGGGGGDNGQPDFWGAHDQQVATDFANAADETLAAANVLQMEAGLGPPDTGIQVTSQYTIFQTGNPGPSWIDEHYDQSTVLYIHISM